MPRWIRLVLFGVLMGAVGYGLWVYRTNFEPRYESGVARIGSYAPADDPRRIVISFVVGQGDRVLEPIVVEDAREVRVTVPTEVMVPPGGARDPVGLLSRREVALRDPLGDRQVIDGASLRAVPRAP